MTQVWAFSNAQAAQNEALQQCWSPAALLHRPGEKSIHRTPYDPAVEPEGAGPALAPLPQSLRGSIRRVELPKGEKFIALTFDLCENANEVSGYDGEIVDTLRKNGVKATFFASGKWLLDHPERGQQLLADPLFQVGGHSWVHRNFRLLSLDEVREDIALNQKADLNAQRALRSKSCYRPNGDEEGGVKPFAVFRFPFGTCTADSLKAVNDAGVAAIQWDVVSADPAPSQSAEAIRKAVVGSAKPGSIVVMHGNGRGWHTSEALPAIVSALRAKGFEFVTVSELLAKGRPVAADSCYENKPGDNLRYDKLFHSKGPAIGIEARQTLRSSQKPAAPGLRSN